MRFSRARKQKNAMCAPIAIIMPFADFSRALPSEKIEKMSLKDAKKALNKEGDDVG